MGIENESGDSYIVNIKKKEVVYIKKSGVIK